MEKISCREERRSTGALFWRALKADYSDAVDAEDDSLVLAKAAKLPDKLWSAFKALLRNDRVPINTWAQTAAEASETEAVILAKAILMINPTGLGNSFQVGLTLLRAFQRCRIHEKWPRIHTAIKQKADTFLVQARHL